MQKKEIDCVIGNCFEPLCIHILQRWVTLVGFKVGKASQRYKIMIIKVSPNRLHFYDSHDIVTLSKMQEFLNHLVSTCSRLTKSASLPPPPPLPILHRHEFHKKCVDPWLKIKQNCPMCKAPITSPSTASSHLTSSLTNNNRATSPVLIDATEFEMSRDVEAQSQGSVESESSSTSLSPLLHLTRENIPNDSGVTLSVETVSTQTGSERGEVEQVAIPIPT